MLEVFKEKTETQSLRGWTGQQILYCPQWTLGAGYSWSRPPIGMSWPSRRHLQGLCTQQVQEEKREEPQLIAGLKQGKPSLQHQTTILPWEGYLRLSRDKGYFALVKPPLMWTPSRTIRRSVIQAWGTESGDKYPPSDAATDVLGAFNYFNGFFCVKHGDNDASSQRGIDVLMT